MKLIVELDMPEEVVARLLETEAKGMTRDAFKNLVVTGLKEECESGAPEGCTATARVED